MAHFLYCRDCKDIDIVAMGLDHVITDPPYSERTHRVGVTQTDGVIGHNNFGFKSLDEETANYIMGACRVATGSSLIFSDHNSIPAWMKVAKKNNCEVIRVIPWLRWSGPSIIQGRPPSTVEFILLIKGEDSQETFSGPGNFSCFEAKALRGSNKHKTEKPLELMLQILQMFTGPNSRIFDPCMGSGTTGMAAKLLGRHFLGCELEGEWYEHATERLDAQDMNPRDAEGFERFRTWLEETNEEKVRIALATEKVRQSRQKAAPSKRRRSKKEVRIHHPEPEQNEPEEQSEESEDEE